MDSAVATVFDEAQASVRRAMSGLREACVETAFHASLFCVCRHTGLSPELVLSRDGWSEKRARHLVIYVMVTHYAVSQSAAATMLGVHRRTVERAVRDFVDEVAGKDSARLLAAIEREMLHLTGRG